MDSYHVLQLVGEGSYGRVYKGRRRFTGQVVAMKFMPKKGRSESELRSLKREIEIMRGLQHPNIVPLYDSFETKSEVVVVTEYAEGQLFQILQDDGNLPESQVREIACQLVSALYYLHAHRIIHRDMKPQNILLGSSGVVKLCDFGFARAMSVSTLVVTSIKGTPLYMSPELVEERPYDHTADLWSLGCILYELHTGAPPFFTNSLFQLALQIVKDQVKWPDTMSDPCKSLLKGLLTKDPQKRLSWPDLLHHPFVADGVLVIPDKSVLSALVATPSPDMLALKLQQVKEKTVPRSGESRLLRKAREQRGNGKGEKPSGSDGAKVEKHDTRAGRVNSATAAATPGAEPPSSDVTVTAADDESLHPKNQSHLKSKARSQISRDYEQEFPVHGQVGSRLSRRCSEDSRTPLRKRDVDSEDGGEEVVPASPGSQRSKRWNRSAVIPELRSQILAFRTQLTDGEIKEAWWIHQPLKDLLDLILTSDLEKSRHIGQEVGLPRVLFELTHVAVESSNFIKQPWSLPTLREILVVLIIYSGKHSDWGKEEQRLEEFTKPFITILSQPSLASLAPLAASVLSLMTQHSVDVKVDMDNLTACLKNLLLDSYEPQLPPLPGWGLCDGLLSLLLHNLYERENGSGASCLDPVMFLDLWKRIGASLAKAKPDTDFCSANGLYSFLSTSLFVFTEDPYACIPLFSEPTSTCVYTLCRLLATDCLHLFAAGSPERPEVGVSHDSVSVLSCHLLFFPFALDLPPRTMSTILQLYDSCGIVASLLQVIQTLPAPLLEMPLSLLSRMLLCDPGRSFPRLRGAASGFFAPPGDGQLTSTEHRTPQTRTASSLLSELLQQDGLWDSAKELLIVLSQVARRYSQHSPLRLQLEPSVLRQALSHPDYQIRVATLRLLGNLNPLRPPALQPDIFQNLIDCLHDPSKPLRRMACRAVRNWLGYLAAGAACKMRKSNGKGCDTACLERELHKQKCSRSDTASGLSTIVEQGEDSEEGSGWLEKATMTVPKLASLITDADALTRRHGCAALGNLVDVDGAASVLLEEDAFGLLLKAACTDSHYEVRQAAIATLCLYSGEDSTRQILMSLNASKSLLKASQRAPPQCDYHRLIGLLGPVHQQI